MKAKEPWLAKVPGRAWVIVLAALGLTAMGAMYFARCGGGLRLFRYDDAIAASTLAAVALLAVALAHAFKTRATKFIRCALVGLLVLAAAFCLVSPSRRSGAVAFFRGDTHERPPSAQRLLALQEESVRAFRSTPWFAPNGGDAARALPVRFACMSPASSALMFGKWFLVLGLLFYGVLAVALVCCWRRSRSEAKKVFIFFSGAGVLVPAALGFSGSLGLFPMMYINVPLLSFGLASLLTTWTLLGAIAASEVDLTARRMKRVVLVLLVAAVAGCATRQSAVVSEREFGDTGRTAIDARFAHMKRLLGIDDEVLSDTNRFVLGSSGYGLDISLDKPFGGFTSATFYLEEQPRLTPRTSDGKPHRLCRVELRRWLSSESDVVAEFQSACDFVADILDVEHVQVRLVDIGKWRGGSPKFMLLAPLQSSMVFELAKGQSISVRLNEPQYAKRDGKMVFARPGCVEIDMDFNKSLGFFVSRRGICELPGEKEIDIGPDCADKLAAALKIGVERRARRKERGNAL